jgi:hypothetical protein
MNAHQATNPCSVRARLERALAGEPVEWPAYLVYDKFLWLHPPLGWFQQPAEVLADRVRGMCRDAGPRRYCLMISEDVPPHWETQVPVVLDTLRRLSGSGE